MHPSHRAIALRRGTIFYWASSIRWEYPDTRNAHDWIGECSRSRSLSQLGMRRALTSNRNNISSPLLAFLLRDGFIPSPPPSSPPFIYRRFSSSVYPSTYLSIALFRSLLSSHGETFFYIYLFPKRPSPPATLYLTFLLNHLAALSAPTGSSGWKDDGKREEGGLARGWISLILLLGQFRNLARVLLILTE